VARSFRRVGGNVRASLSHDELDLLRGLPEQLRTILTEGEADPATERLFPPAYLDDSEAEAQADYRRLSQSELLATKVAALELVKTSLERATRKGQRWLVELSEEEALAWLGVLNDVRLTLGVRLEVTEDLDGEIDPTDPRAPGFRLLYYLGWLEEHLVEALSA
jgi:uncharacterized protein DUF2017